MRINKYMSRCMLGVMAAALWCFSFVLPARADICFLPTGICEQGAQAKVAEGKTCDDYLDIYYPSEQEGMSCQPANIPGCDLWNCTGLDCEDQGYKSGTSNSPTKYPTAFPSSMFDCEYCLLDGTYYWKCNDKECADGYFVRNDPNHSCTGNLVWVAKSEGGMSGHQECGKCEQWDQLCPEGNDIYTYIPAGCKTCQVVEDFGNGHICYKCHNMSAEYVTAAEKEAQFDDSCFKYETKTAADASTCYRPIDMECGTDQYKTETTINGKKMCKCYDHTYEFRLTNSSDANIVLSAAGENRNVDVTSLRCGNGCEFWEFTQSVISGNGQLNVTKANGSSSLLIKGPVNKSQTDDLYYKIKLTQMWGDEASYSPDLYIDVRVEHDTCPNNLQFPATCQPGYKSKVEGTSVTGENCHNCYNDDCGDYTNYGVGGTCPTDGNYNIKYTDFGSTCCEPKPDDCPPDYTKGATPTVGKYFTTTTAFGSNCYMPKPDNCPSSDYTNYGIDGTCPTDGNYDVKYTDFGSTCCAPLSDECPGVQKKSGQCECGEATAGDKTPFGSQCYYCQDCCPVGDNGAYGPGTWGAACQSDSDCQASSDFSLICVNKVNGCGECKECGKEDYQNNTIEDCKDVTRRNNKGAINEFHYIESTSGPCELYIGNHCMVRDPVQQYDATIDGGICPNHPCSEAKDCQVPDGQPNAGACKPGCYPDIKYDSTSIWWYRCQIPYDGSETVRCTSEGECVWQ